MIEYNKDFIILNDAFPDLGRRIKFLWGDKLCRTFIHDLLHSTRDGHREGFPQTVSAAIIGLSLKHDADFLDCVPPELATWSTESNSDYHWDLWDEAVDATAIPFKAKENRIEKTSDRREGRNGRRIKDR
jgi:hypothetical protein